MLLCIVLSYSALFNSHLLYSTLCGIFSLQFFLYFTFLLENYPYLKKGNLHSLPFFESWAIAVINSTTSYVLFPSTQANSSAGSLKALEAANNEKVKLLKKEEGEPLVGLY